MTGTDTGRVPLSHDGEEGGIVLSGRLEVTVGEERRILGPGAKAVPAPEIAFHRHQAHAGLEVLLQPVAVGASDHGHVR